MSDYESLSDIELLTSIRADDTMAFRTIYERHWKALYLRACKSVDEDEAKDMIQEVMVSLWNRRQQIDIKKEDEIIRYLFTALKYRVISHYAYTTARIKKDSLFEVGTAITPDHLLENKELGMLLDTVVENMPDRMQLIFKMSREENLSISDIAFKLKISDQTVKNQVTQALKRLRDFISSHQKQNL